MTALTRCDACNAEKSQGEGQEVWLRVHAVNPPNLSRGDIGYRSQGDFCSWRCLADVALAHAQVADRPTGPTLPDPITGELFKVNADDLEPVPPEQ